VPAFIGTVDVALRDVDSAVLEDMVRRSVSQVARSKEAR